MTDRPQDQTGFSQQSLADRFDLVCDSFERAWSSDERPRIEEYLTEIKGPERSTLLRELLLVELDVRRQRGERPVAAEYAGRFPLHQELIDNVFALPGDRASIASNVEQDTEARAQDTTDQKSATSPAGQYRECEPTLASPTHRATPDSRVTDSPLREFGDYELLEEIARGGMGVVYKARQKKANRIVALKMILSGRIAGDDEVLRFETEAEAAAKLDHPGIVPIYQVGEHAEQHFFSMGYVGGPNLSERLRDGPLPAREAAELMQAIAQAVQYAHDHGVVHRDLKPSNILIGEDGCPRVTDFGLAKQIEGNSDLTATGQIMGTPSFMPPEQASGQAGEVGPLADVYALGALLYCLLTGRPPFQAASIIDTLKQVLDQEPVSPRQLNPAIDRDLETICLKCLEKNPGNRYPSAEEVSIELQRFLNRQPIQARPISTAGHLWRWCLRRPMTATLLAVSAAATALLCVLGISLIAAYQHTRIQQLELDRQKLAVSAAEEMANIQKYYATVSNVREMRANPELGWTDKALDDLQSASQLIPVGESPLHIRDELAACLAETDFVELPTILPDSEAQAICFSHDGSQIAVTQMRPPNEFVAAFTCKVHIVKVPDGDIERELSFPRDVFLPVKTGKQDRGTQVAFSPDDGLLVVGTQGGLVYAWDLSQPTPKARLIGKHRAEVSALAFAPEGDFVVSASHDATVRRWSVALAGVEEAARYDAAGPVNDLSVHLRRRIVAVGCGDHALILNLDTLEPMVHVKLGTQLVSLSPQGSTLAAHVHGEVTLVDLANRGDFDNSPHPNHLRPIPRAYLTMADADLPGVAHLATVKTLEFNPDGSQIASTGNGRTKIWQVASGRLLANISTSALSEQAVFGANGQLLATIARQGVRLFAVQGGDVQQFIAHHPREIHDVAFVDSGRKLACLTDDYSILNEWAWTKQVTIWDVESGKMVDILRYPRHGGGTDHDPRLAVCLGQGLIAFSQQSADVEVFDLGRRTHVRLHNGDACMQQIEYSDDGELIVGKVGNTKLVAWRVEDRSKLWTWDNSLARITHGNATLSDFAVGRQWITVATENGQLKLLDRDSGQVEREFPIGLSEGVQIDMTTDERVCAVGFSSGKLQILDLERGKPVEEVVNAHRDAVTSAEFADNDRTLVTSDANRTICIWMLGPPKLERQQNLRFPGSIKLCRTTADGQHLAVVLANESSVRVWNLSQLRKRQTLGNSLRHQPSGENREATPNDFNERRQPDHDLESSVPLPRSENRWVCARLVDGKWQDFRSIAALNQDHRLVLVDLSIASHQGEIHAAITTSDGHLWHTRRNGPRWLPARRIDLPMAASSCGHIVDAACITDDHDVLRIYVLTQDGHLWQTNLNEHGWESFGDFEYRATVRGGYSSIAAARTDNHSQFCALSRDGRFWHTLTSVLGVQKFNQLEVNRELQLAHVTCCAGSGLELHVVAVSQHGAILHRVRTNDSTNNAWTDFADLTGIWKNVPPSPYISATCALRQGELHVVAVTSEGSIVHNFRLADNSWGEPTVWKAGRASLLPRVELLSNGRSMELHVVEASGLVSTLHGE